MFRNNLQEYLVYVSGLVGSSGLSGTILELTALGAWAANEMQVPAALSMVLGAYSTRWALSIWRR